MRILPSISITLLLVCCASMAVAGPRRKTNKAPPSAPTNCEATGSIKRCYIDGDAAEFSLEINRGSTLLVTLEEPPAFSAGDAYVRSEAIGNSVAFRMRQDSLPKGHSLLIRTATSTITLMLRDVSSGGDTQVHILRASNADRDRLVEARVQARLAEYKSEHKKALNDLEKKAAILARQSLLNELHASGGSISSPSGEVRARNDFLVLRATKGIRIGKERLLQVSIEERKGDTFSIGEFNVTVTQNGAKRSVDADFRCSEMRVRPGKQVSCYVSLGTVDKSRGKASVDIAVAGEGGERSVRLRKVDIR